MSPSRLAEVGSPTRHRSGTSPRAFLKDLADDPSFNGFVIVGVTTVLFFTQEGGLRESALKFHREETLSQRADHLLSMPLEQFFAFIDDQSRPRRQVQIWPFPLREGMLPRFDPRKLEIMTADRNTEMWARVVNDPAYQAEAKAQWEIGFRIFAPPPGPNGEPPAPMPPEAVGAVIAGWTRPNGLEIARVRVPYATEAPSGDGRVLGARWSFGERSGELAIPEQAVLAGGEVALP